MDPRRRQQVAHPPSPTSHRACGDGGEQRVATGMHIAITRYTGHVYRATHSLTSAPMGCGQGKDGCARGQDGWWWLSGARRDVSGQYVRSVHGERGRFSGDMCVPMESCMPHPRTDTVSECVGYRYTHVRYARQSETHVLHIFSKHVIYTGNDLSYTAKHVT